MELIILIVLYGGYSFLLGFLLHKYLINSTQKHNLKKANVSGIRWESQSKPILGGITFFCIFMFGIINYVLLFKGEFLTSTIAVGVILVVTVSFLIGLADDLLNSSPIFKSTAQFACALLLINFDIYIKIFETPMLNYMLTIFWVLGVMNSINMLDNMDAITSSVSLLILSFMILIAVTLGEPEIWFYLILLVSGISSVGSFLIFNWHPSKMYMGDNGSMFLGALLSILGILFVWNIPAQSLHHPGLTPLLLIWLIFTVPITDTTTVSINRLLKGNSPFVGGRDHTTHFLSYIGLKDWGVALVMIAISIISLTLAGWLYFVVKNPTSNQILLFSIWPATVFITLYTMTRIVKPKQKTENA